MGGSRKGEHRGNAKKRISGHETPNDVIRDAVRQKSRPRSQRSRNLTSSSKIEQRIMIARVINGDTGNVRDMAPKEIMLDNMWEFMQVAVDYREMWKMAISIDPQTPQSIDAIALAEREIERNRLLSQNCAYQVYPLVHGRRPPLAPEGIIEDTDANIMQRVLDEIDRRRQERPLVIEHDPTKKIA